MFGFSFQDVVREFPQKSVLISDSQFCIQEQQTFFIFRGFGRKHQGVSDIHIAFADGAKIVASWQIISSGLSV